MDSLPSDGRASRSPGHGAWGAAGWGGRSRKGPKKAGRNFRRNRAKKRDLKGDLRKKIDRYRWVLQWSTHFFNDSRPLPQLCRNATRWRGSGIRRKRPPIRQSCIGSSALPAGVQVDPHPTMFEYLTTGVCNCSFTLKGQRSNEASSCVLAVLLIM